ncbi:MAG TPA: glutamine synthetase family protein [Dehalococcoidia bacterium]|nr:glutamine synthetase family protein [Dehalococcoidia bacterium]
MNDEQERQETKEYVLQHARDQDVKFIRLWFTDIVGSLKSLAITVEELENVLDEGMIFDGSAIEGFARHDETDMVAMPDPTTFQVLPWRPRSQAVARLICDIQRPDGTPFEGDPRYVLRRNLERAAQLGYTFYVEPELEFFYFKNPESTEGLDDGGYLDLTPLDVASDLRRETVLALEAMGIGVEYSHHEVAASQHEIGLRYTDALTMADAAMTYRMVVKEVALRHGVYATFMPKPVSGMNGSGMHTHQSLFRGETNAFYDAAAPYHLSAVAQGYVAGLLRHAREITLITNQWVNSYKRLLPGYEAPVYLTWAARRNWSNLVRIPELKTGRPDQMRVEYRAPDPACNPYLAFAAMLAAGLDGVEKEYPLPEPVEANVFAMSPEERQRRGIGQLPGDLHEAIEAAAASELLRDALGEHLMESFVQNKLIEWEAFRGAITDFELKRYLPVL